MKIIHLFTLLFFSTISFSQKKPIGPLAIGSKVPDISFNKVLNYKSNKAKLSDFKGKLIILDLWATTCTSCIEKFPDMDSLQKQFKDKIQILLVNPHKTKYETLDRIKNVVEKFKIRTGFYPGLPIPVFDTILNSYFPHKTVPHEVWIDGNGTLIAITNALAVTAENIQTVLSGKPLDVFVKNDLQKYDRNNPLEFDGNGNRVKPLYFSAFTPYIGGVSGSRPAYGLKSNDNKEITGFFIFNNSLRGFLYKAYREFGEFPESRVVLNVRNLLQYKSGQRDTAYMYCYDLTIPPTSPKEVKQQSVYLKEDLKRFFNVTVTRKTKKLKSLILTSTDSVSKSFTKFKEKKFDIEKNSIKKYFHNYPINEIINMLGARLSVPLINESAVTQNIDLDFPDNFDMFDLSNLEGLKRVFENAGFAVKEEDRELEVLVISDKITEPESVPSPATRTKTADLPESDTAIIKRQLTGYRSQKKNIAINFLAENPNSQYSPVVISELWDVRKIDSSEGMSLYKNLSAEVQQTMWGLIAKAQIQKSANNDLKIPPSAFIFQLSGQIAGLSKGDTVYLLHRKFPNLPVDTAIKIVEENSFSFIIRRPVAGAAFYRLQIGKNSNKILKIFLNTEKVTITGTVADFDKANVQGSKANDDYLRYNKLIEPVDKKIDELFALLKKSKN